MEVDAVGRGEPVAVALGGGARRVAVRPGERAAEALDRLVAGRERGVGHRRPLADLPGRALEHHPAPHGHRRLAGAARELAAEVVRRGVRAAGHVAERLVVLVEDGVEQLAQSVAAAAVSVMSTSLPPTHPRPTRPILLSPSIAASARSTRSGSSYRTQVMRGSLRNHESWRRANLRVAVVGLLAGLVERELAGEVRRDLAVADRAAGGAALGQPLVEQPGHLVDEAVLEHPVHPQLDPLRRGWAGRCRRRPGRWRGSSVLEPRQRRAERAAGDLDDLERADHAAAVLGQDPLGRLGVEGRQPSVQRAGARPRRARPRAASRTAGSVPGNSNRSRIARV